MTTIPQPQTPIQHKPNTLFVGGISYKASEDDLKECFSKYGEVQEVKIIRDKFNFNQSKGYGFVTFADQPGADRAKQEGFVTLMGKTMNVGDAYRGGTRGNGGTDGGTRGGTQPGTQQRPPRTYQNYGNYPQHGQNAGQYTTYDPQHQYIQYPYYPHQQHLENPYYQYYYMQQQQQHVENPEHAGEATTQPTGYNFYSGHQQQGWGNQVPAHPAQQQNTQQ